ncbi:FHA domain protein [Gottschalkia purinilytica]|uniref:FHA domain protein n=1 Tax=Gottschalkia purinilytica TaxID=1503 RepID=A0A0L0WDG8_GOTPU|nr:FHA domain protein [Gottschalkia purinilytica]
MFNIVSLTFRYIFIVLIYLFMLGIIRLIYLDIKSMRTFNGENSTYLKLINRKETVPFKIKDEYTLENEVKIGRSNQNDIVIRDPYLSKNHARIITDEGQFFVEDLKSINGTYINNNRIYDVTKLKNGDRIKVGQIEFLFVDQD